LTFSFILHKILPMHLTLNKGMAEAIGLAKLAPFGLGAKDWSWKNEKRLSLSQLDDRRLGELEKIFSDAVAIDGVSRMLKDVSNWRTAVKDIGKTNPKTLRQFSAMLAKYLLDVPGHRVYAKRDDVWLSYYVNSVRFHEGDFRHQVAPSVTMNLLFEDMSGRHSTSRSFDFSDCKGRNVVETLLGSGYVAETRDLRSTYLEEVKRFSEIHKEVGKQFLASGTGTDDLDGNYDDGERYRGTKTVQLIGSSGEPTRVVIDVLHENEVSSNGRSLENDKISVTFWQKVKKGNARPYPLFRGLSNLFSKGPLLEFPLE
jgi:hypothetical protein